LRPEWVLPEPPPSQPVQPPPLQRQHEDTPQPSKPTPPTQAPIRPALRPAGLSRPKREIRLPVRFREDI
jgi:hypothetical protein